MTIRILLILALFSSVNSWAQDSGNAQKYGWELGAHIGNMLPNQVDGVTEITPQWGLRTAFGLGKSYLEFGGTAGKGEGVEWSDLSASIRIDMDIESFTGIAYIGGDAIYYQGVDRPKKIFGGGHIGGGIMTLISDALWFRTDMKFNVNPGTSLYIGFGFTFRFSGESSSGS